MKKIFEGPQIWQKQLIIKNKQKSYLVTTLVNYLIFYLQVCCLNGGGAIRLLPRMGAWRNSTETQQSGHVLSSGPEVNAPRSFLVRTVYWIHYYTNVSPPHRGNAVPAFLREVAEMSTQLPREVRPSGRPQWSA